MSCCFKTESLLLVQKFPRIVRMSYNLEILTQHALINSLQCGKFSEFLELINYGSYCILYRLFCLGRLLLCLHCLHMFACLMILFEDRSIKYAKAFSMQYLIIILVIFYSRE